MTVKTGLGQSDRSLWLGQSGWDKALEPVAWTKWMGQSDWSLWLGQSGWDKATCGLDKVVGTKRWSLWLGQSGWDKTTGAWGLDKVVGTKQQELGAWTKWLGYSDRSSNKVKEPVAWTLWDKVAGTK